MGADPALTAIFDVDLEQALIGVCLIDERAALESEGLCDADDFYDPLHQRIWASMAMLRAKGVAATPMTLGAQMADDVGLMECGGRDYLKSIALAAPAMPNYEAYCRLIADLAHRRLLDSEMEAARSRLHVIATPILECVTDVLAAAGAASARAARDAGYLPLPDAVDRMLQETEDAINGKEPPSVKTGLTELDAITGGFQSGDMVVIAGRPGSGKTVMLSGIARAAAAVGRPVILFELEMRRKAILHRMIADIDYDLKGWLPPLAYSRMRSGKVSSSEFDRMIAASDRLRAMPIEIFDTPGMTIHEIESHAARFAGRSQTMGAIAIDYLQIIVAGDRYAGSKVAEMTEVSNAIKRMAKRIGWPVIVGCQLNREIEKRENRRPQLSDLRETGAIEQDADTVIGLHRPAYYVARKQPEKGRDDPGWMAWLEDRERAEHVLELSVCKNRSGPEGLIECFVDIGASAVRNGKTATHGSPNEAGVGLI